MVATGCNVSHGVSTLSNVLHEYAHLTLHAASQEASIIGLAGGDTPEALAALHYNYPQPQGVFHYAPKALLLLLGCGSHDYSAGPTPYNLIAYWFIRLYITMSTAQVHSATLPELIS